MTSDKSVLSYQTLQRLIDDLNSNPLKELVLGQRTYRGAHFYTVEPIGGDWRKMEAWTRKMFGQPADVWDFKMDNVGQWYCNDRRFWFRNEVDRTMFILKWQ
jgi:hypothetical protein